MNKAELNKKLNKLQKRIKASIMGTWLESKTTEEIMKKVRKDEGD